MGAKKRAARGRRPSRPRRRRAGRRRWLRALIWLPLLTFAVSAVLVLPWRWLPPPTTAFMLRDSITRSQAGRPPIAQRWTPWRQISPWVPAAVVAAEDQKFPTHHGFDLVQIARAVEERRDRPRGASTISQQVAKNLFLWPGRSLVRKGVEAYLTLLIELMWPKRRILEVYLNVAEFGSGVYGVSAASDRHFGLSPATLSLHQASLLAAVLPSPRRMSAGAPSEYVRARAAEIEALVVGLGGASYLGRL
jgi:monofunctional biosynthetic peptidoglycan transglycosylase